MERVSTAIFAAGVMKTVPFHQNPSLRTLVSLETPQEILQPTFSRTKPSTIRKWHTLELGNPLRKAPKDPGQGFGIIRLQKYFAARVTDSVRFAVKEVKATKMTTSRNTVSNPIGTKIVPVAAQLEANAAVKNVCNGFVADFGVLLGWTLLRHRSGDAVNGVDGRY